MMFNTGRPSVIDLVHRVRSGRPTRLLVVTVWLGLVVAAVAAARTDAALHRQAAAAAREDRLVTATVRPLTMQQIGRSLVRTVALTWSYPLGVVHRGVDSVPYSAQVGHQRIWVNAAGLRTSGPPTLLGLVMGVGDTVVEVLLVTGVLVVVLNAAVPGWHRRRLRSLVNLRWANLVHSYWEDL